MVNLHLISPRKEKIASFKAIPSIILSNSKSHADQKIELTWNNKIQNKPHEYINMLFTFATVPLYQQKVKHEPIHLTT